MTLSTDAPSLSFQDDNPTFDELQRWMEAGEPVNPHARKELEPPLIRPMLRYPWMEGEAQRAGELGTYRDAQVKLLTGQLYYDVPIITLAGHMPISLSLIYLSGPDKSHSGWRLNVDEQWHRVLTPQQGYQHWQADGSRYEYRYQPDTNALQDISLPANIVSWRVDSDAPYQAEDKFQFHLTHPDGTVRCFQQGRLSQVTDVHGHCLSISRNAHGQITQITNCSGSQFQLRYNSQAQLSEIEDHSGRVWQLRYENNQLVQLRAPWGAHRQFHYQRVTGASEPLLSQVFNSSQEVLLKATYHPDARVAKAWQKHLETVCYHYHDAEHYVQVNQQIVHLHEHGWICGIEALDGHRFLEWDEAKREAKITLNGQTADVKTFDTTHRLIEHRTAQQRIRYEYAKENRQPNLVRSKQGERRYVYDVQGNCTLVVDENGLKTQTEYDAHGKPVYQENSLGAQTTYRYNRYGQIIAIIDQDEALTQFEYNGSQQLSAMVDAAGQRLDYRYVGPNRLANIDDGKAAIEFDLNSEGQLKGVKQGEHELRYAYDEHGCRFLQGNSLKHIRSIDYHPDTQLPKTITQEDGRIIEIDFQHISDVQRIVTTTEDEQSTLIFNGQGQLEQANNTHRAIRFDYDVYGQVTDQWQQDEHVRHAWLSDCCLHSQIHGQETVYQRDKQGKLITLITPEEHVIHQQFDVGGRVTERRYPNGLTECFRYTPDGFISQLSTAGQCFDYHYDNVGQLIEVNGQRFGYDQGHLTHDGQTAYQFDGQDNLIAKGDQTHWRYDFTTNRLLENDVYRFAYDVLGRLVSKTHKASQATLNYQYNQSSQLIRLYGERVLKPETAPQACDLRFQYDALGRRIQKQDGQKSIQYYYDEQRIIAMHITNGEEESHWVYLTHDDATDTPLSIHSKQGCFYYHRNSQGSIIALSDARGEIVETLDYDVFGTLIAHDKHIDTFNPYAFTGRELDAPDLYFYRARYYDPSLARFLTPDPMESFSGQANLYSYTGGDPVNYVDPFGYKKKCVSEKLATKLDKVTKKLGKRLGKAASKRVATTMASLATGPGAAVVAVGNLIWTGWDIYKSRYDIFELRDLLMAADLDYSQLDPLDMMMATMDGEPAVPVCPKNKPKPTGKGASAANSKGNPPKGSECGCPVGKPVNPANGSKVLRYEQELDFTIQAPMPLVWQRYYNSSNPHVGLYGQGWSSLADAFLLHTAQHMAFVEPHGRTLKFDHLEVGEQDLWVVEQLTLYRADEQIYHLITPDKSRLHFQPSIRDRFRYQLVKVEDAHGNSLTYWYNGLNQAGQDDVLTHIVTQDKRGFELSYQETGQGKRLKAITEVGVTHSPQGQRYFHPKQVWVSYRYSDQGDLIEVRNHQGRLTRTFDYQNHMMVMHSQPGGFESRYRYDQYSPKGKVTCNALSTGESWQFDYALGQTTVTDHLGRETVYQFDEHEYLTAKTDALGHTERYELNNAGLVEQILDPAGGVQALKYDSRGNPTLIKSADGRSLQIRYAESIDKPESITDDLGQTTTLAYDEYGNVIEETASNGGITRYQYSEQGWLTDVTDALGNVYQFDYDKRGNLVQQTDCSGQVTHYHYDDYSQLTRLTNALGQSTQYQYDDEFNLSQIVYSDGSTERFAYDALGHLIEHRDAEQNVTRYQVDSHGRLTQRVNPLGHTLDYHYDSVGRLRTLLNENGVAYQFTYDPLDRLIQEQGLDGLITQYRYDPLGNVKSKLENPNCEAQRETQYVRDKAGRLLEKYIGQNGQEARTRYSYDDIGQLTQASNATAKVEFDYDAMGNVTQEVTTSDFGQQSVCHQYDLLGNRTQTLLPTGQTLKSLYYGSGHLLQINIDNQTISEFSRNALHQETQRSQGVLHTQQRYDALGRLTHQQVYQSALLDDETPTLTNQAAKLSRRYRYGVTGELNTLEDSRTGITHYRYDKLGRILGSQGPNIEETFAFDPAHNLIPINDSGTQGLIQDNRLKVFEDKRYQYDAYGNLAEKKIGSHTTLTLNYDAEHQLIQSRKTQHAIEQVTQYFYDPFGRRIAKQDRFNTTTFLWDGNRLLLETRGSKAKTYVYEPQGFVPIAQVVSHLDKEKGAWPYSLKPVSSITNDILHYHVDHLGTPRELTDSDGHYVWAAQYKAWGNTLKVEYPELTQKAEQEKQRGVTVSIHELEIDYRQNLRFQGQYFDEETGLHYNRFRYYDPDIGRFVTQDPIGLLGGDNLYQYANNPTAWIDPLGLSKRRRVTKKAGSAGVDRTGKAFTPKTKREIDEENAAQNGGVNRCTDCGIEVVPGKKHQRGVTPPDNERHRDHIIPKSKGGDGTLDNGQILCRTCNLDKSNN
ncbi:RHS repeat-associated core domain-containing protein [Vibrio sp. TBV020]|uniref:RHS repeat-associated core domain-containing protein n=1 Tax=Vibrio sp. TBV020 TaxID=3137398 RepID=UPI0038CD98E0